MFNKHSSNVCPFLNKECIKEQCQLWTHIRGNHPQIQDEFIDMYDCSIKWIPVLLIENSKVSRETAAEVQTFRKDMVSSNQLALAFHAQANGFLPG